MNRFKKYLNEETDDLKEKKMSRFKDYLNEETADLFDKSNVEDARKQIERQVNAPHVKVNVSTLGGRPSLIINISLDEKKDWINNIYENSRYTRFHLEPGTNKSNLEQFQIHHKLRPKFRKSKVKTVDAAINKINIWINKVK